MDVHKYLKRIGYNKKISESTPRDNCLLNEIVETHIHHVPFENLDIHRGKRISIDLYDVYAKIVGQHRGGYCFEMNGLLGWALREIGFEVTRHAAKVARPALPDLWGPKTHTCNIVYINGNKYLADVGIGNSPTGSVLIKENEEQTLSDGITYRTLLENETIFLQFYDRKDNFWQYKTAWTLDPKEMNDFEWANNFIQTDPNSKFMKKSVACLVGPELKKTLAGDKYIVTNMKTGERNERDVDLEEFHSILKTEFEIVLDDENGKYKLSLEPSKMAPKNFWTHL